MNYKIYIDNDLPGDYWYASMGGETFHITDKIDDDTVVFFGLIDPSHYYMVTEGKYDGCLILKKHATKVYLKSRVWPC